MGERDGSGGGAAAPALAFCLGAPRPAQSAPLPLLLLSCWAPQELLVRTRSPSPRGNRSLALSPKLRGAPRRPRSTLSGGRKRPSGSAPERRGAGERGRREKGGLVRAPAGSTHTPFLPPGAGQADAAEFSGPGAWASPPSGARGAGATGGQARGQGRRGRRPRGGGAQLCPLALGGDGAVCTPLRRSRSSADGWDLKFFLPLWKSGREGGVLLPWRWHPYPPSPRGRPDDSGPLLLSCDGPVPAHTRTSPSPPPGPVLLQSRLPFGCGRNRSRFKLLGSGLSFCGLFRVAGGGGTSSPCRCRIFCLSGTYAWRCFPAGWFSGHRGDVAGHGMGSVVRVCFVSGVREEVERKIALSAE